jgi:hypothetical protein
MARSRMIKPEFWDDEKLATNTSRDARLTYIALWSHADDFGVVKGHPAWLRNKIFPYDDIELPQFRQWLEELESVHCILPFEAAGEKYYYIRTFLKHQTINRPSQQRNPSPPAGLVESPVSIHGALTDETEEETELNNETETKVEETNSPKAKHLRFVYLSDKELQALVGRIGTALTNEYIERLDGYFGQIGESKSKRRYLSHYDTILNWYRKDSKEGKLPRSEHGTAKTSKNWRLIEEARQEHEQKYGGRHDG